MTGNRGYGIAGLGCAPRFVVETLPPYHPTEDLPVFFAGRPLATEETLAGLAEAVASSSAQGICVGHNIFQRDDPRPLLARIRELLDG